jgi:hypothetical protein
MERPEVESVMEASFVPKEYIPELWPKVRPFITEVVKHTHGRYTTEDVLDVIMNGSHLFWMAFKGKEVYGMVVTTFANYPRAKFLSCPFVTGKEFKSWKDPMLKVLRKWAEDNQCDGIESTARLGWARMFKDDGYEALWQTFQLPLYVDEEAE